MKMNYFCNIFTLEFFHKLIMFCIMKSSYVFSVLTVLILLNAFSAQAQRAARGTATSTTTSTILS